MLPISIRKLSVDELDVPAEQNLEPEAQDLVSDTPFIEYLPS